MTTRSEAYRRRRALAECLVARARDTGALGSLTEREQFVLEQRFGGDVRTSQAELADRLGISRERVRQIEAAALQTLAANMQDPS